MCLLVDFFAFVYNFSLSGHKWEVEIWMARLSSSVRRATENGGEGRPKFREQPGMASMQKHNCEWSRLRWHSAAAALGARLRSGILRPISTENARASQTKKRNYYSSAAAFFLFSAAFVGKICLEAITPAFGAFNWESTHSTERKEKKWLGNCVLSVVNWFGASDAVRQKEGNRPAKSLLRKLN